MHVLNKKSIFFILFTLGQLSFFQHLTAYTGRHFKYFFTNEKKNIRCTIEYTLTGKFPFEIKRTYADGHTDFIMLDYPKVKNAKALYKLVSQSKDHLIKYMPYMVESYSSSEVHAVSEMQSMILRDYVSQDINWFIFYKPSKDSEWRLIGQVKDQGYGAYKAQSVDAMYWVGAPEIIQAKGLTSTAIQALFNYVIYIGKAKYVNLAIEKTNVKSNRIAKEFLLMKLLSAPKYKRWGYRQNVKDMNVYSLSASAWKKIHWKDSKIVNR
ncbi:MAG: GNAT family N-acetyltransferase [Bacteroidota bacterium]